MRTGFGDEPTGQDHSLYLSLVSPDGDGEDDLFMKISSYKVVIT
jgi:hypothetical protein